MKILFMKIYTLCGLIVLLLISSTVSAQYSRNNGRYSGRYNSRPYYNRYPARPSVSVIAALPFGAISLNFGNRYYHYHNGYYYRPYNRGYMMVPPPVGIIVPNLPVGYTQIIIGSHPYYRYGNVYYVPFGKRYKVVDEPNESDISVAEDNNNRNSTDSEYEKVVLEGKTYYKKGSKYYKAKVSKDGEISYEEVGETSGSK
jgi:hypothetical protein